MCYIQHTSFQSFNTYPRQVVQLLEAHWNCPPWLGTIVTICVNYFAIGSPGKEHETNKEPPTGRVWERSKGCTTCHTASQNPSHWHPCWLSNVYATWKDPESDWVAKDNPETNPITIKPETASHLAEQCSLVPLPSCSLFGPSFPVKSLALSAHVSLHTSHYWVLDKSPLLGPGRGHLPATLLLSLK